MQSPAYSLLAEILHCKPDEIDRRIESTIRSVESQWDAIMARILRTGQECESLARDFEELPTDVRDTSIAVAQVLRIAWHVRTALRDAFEVFGEIPRDTADYVARFGNRLVELMPEGERLMDTAPERIRKPYSAHREAMRFATRMATACRAAQGLDLHGIDDESLLRRQALEIASTLSVIRSWSKWTDPPSPPLTPDSVQRTQRFLLAFSPARIDPFKRLKRMLHEATRTPLPREETTEATTAVPSEQVKQNGRTPTEQPQVRLSDWGVGCEDGRTWWLFRRQKRKGRLGERWDQHGKVDIRAGDSTTLMLALTANYGALSKAEALTIMKDRGDTRRQRMRRVTDGLSKVKQRIQVAISQAAGCNESQVGNPIPGSEDGWRSIIEIGIAVLDDDGHMKLEIR